MNDHKREDNYTLRKSYICEDNFWRSLSTRTRWGYSILSMLELSLNLTTAIVGRGYLPLHLVILAPICFLMPQLP